MSVINKNHPFRESIAHQSSPTPDSTLSEAANGPAGESSESHSHSEKKSIFTSLGPKSKLLLFLSVAGIVCYGYVSLYDSLYPQPQQVKQLTSTDVAMANRSVEDARRSAGLFGRLFCRGMQRSRFCR